MVKTNLKEEGSPSLFAREKLLPATKHTEFPFSGCPTDLKQFHCQFFALAVGKNLFKTLKCRCQSTPLLNLSVCAELTIN